MVEELTSQNARLTAQIEAANQMELQLTHKLHELKSQHTIQNNTLQVNLAFLRLNIVYTGRQLQSKPSKLIY